MHKSSIPNNFIGAISGNNGVLHCEGTTMKNFLMRSRKRFRQSPFFTRLEMLSRLDGFVLYSKLAVDFFFTHELL